ncbi:ABC-three component system middle component 6 [Candidatus Viridilinea mediisalina]|uniref:Uncharacterized protein n=1 Tax=Candidatus Viridilinea mediisalina TaxID=2024553 RepID=A0A2A6RDM6_9CHLR|nr:hypothetical protein CJ255_20395 [Candidatus Viridilinea mediisalina]
MILPSKQINPTKALIAVGGEVLRMLDEPKTVSRLWTELKRSYTVKYGNTIITYDWFVLSLDLLYTMNAIELIDGRIRRVKQ